MESRVIQHRTAKVAAVFDPTDPGPDYTLAWPPTLVRREAEALLRRNARGWSGDAQWLLEEA